MSEFGRTNEFGLCLLLDIAIGRLSVTDSDTTALEVVPLTLFTRFLWNNNFLLALASSDAASDLPLF